MPNYVLITPAKNEQDFIEKTLESVTTQIILPLKWIIVSDGSTDNTDSIVERYSSRFNFIELIKKNTSAGRNFGAKADAIALAYQEIKKLDFEYIGNLDADVSFLPDYYKNILKEFELNPRLGIAGGLRYDLIKNNFYKLNCAPDSVGGPFQLFRRACYEEIGGYKPLRFGGIDAVAETSARMMGWEVRHFPQNKVYHYRQTGMANKNIFKQKFRVGLRNYSIGYHPLFHILKLKKYLFESPYIIGSFIGLAGYIWGAIKNYEMPVSVEFKNYLRREQMDKLKTGLGINKIKRLITNK